MKNMTMLKFTQRLLFSLLLFTVFYGCSQAQTDKKSKEKNDKHLIHMENLEIATFGNGCFWCTEAIFENLKGVHKVVSGYSGGHVNNPTYKEVCTGTTGHAEVVQIYYDPKVIGFDELLEVFWQTHDPTTLNRQGNDIGTQYRSVIFYHDQVQNQLAEKYKKELDKAAIWNDPIVTEISPLEKFYEAEDYHQEYFQLNGNQPYCAFVIRPKVDKFKKVFKDKLK
ncbi:MAG: peptide-methionine (S)-S-oxide reductase MsrA [Cyclobacteriaceae bacterium]|nr:peptide-methionine (S)-S-oxide reductase MsrA [Cyclobacteriaceae bacterium]